MTNIQLFCERKNYTNIPLFAAVYQFGRQIKSYNPPGTPEGMRYCFVEHIHSAFEMIHIISGAVFIETDDERLIAFPGDTVIFNPYEPHCGYVNEQHPDVEYAVMTADLTQLAPMARKNLVEALAQSKTRCERCVRDEAIGAQMRVLPEMNERTGESGGAELAMLAGFYSILAQLDALGCIHHASEREKQLPPFVKKTVDFLSEHYTENITTDQISKYFSYNYSYFCRLFKKHFGCSFYTYLTEYRINLARGLYMEDAACTLSASEIASKVGFDDYCHFTHDFKRLIGMSPTEYMKKHSPSRERLLTPDKKLAESS
ncbi:MAG: AraC family transcriptional regulator [Ruminococcaceae bacterium]|nr:AraC family transcriptional regulator [Oscillospiraceae bacterium]